MPTNPNVLVDKPITPIRAATDALAGGGSIRAWEQAMRRALTTAHTAAYLAAIRDRTGVMPKGLSRAERQELRQAIDAQLRYLEGFARDLAAGKLSQAQAAARAALYAGAVRGTFYQTRWGGYVLPFAPGDGGTACKANCRCHAYVDGDGPEAQYHYVMGAAEHCPDCEARAAGSPYTVRRRAA